MALQWTPLRARGGAVARARQSAQTLEHPTQANVLLAFKLSMVSGNSVAPVSRYSHRSYRKMSDIGVQCDPQDYEPEPEPESPVTCTVAEINNGAEITELDSPTHHRPLSVQSSSSSSSNGEERVGNKRPLSTEELDVDAICVQQSTTEEEKGVAGCGPPAPNKTEPDGFVIQDKEDTSCGLDCMYFAMQCCECVIL